MIYTYILYPNTVTFNPLNLGITLENNKIENRHGVKKVMYSTV